MILSKTLGVLLLLALGAPASGAESPDPAPASTRAATAAVQQAEPAVKAPAAGKKPVRKAPAGQPVAALDRLDLDPTQITGNRELPKVMVIVPWKHADIGDLAGRPVNSLVDEALQPVDREVFRREVAYYDALTPDRPRSETSVTAPKPVSGPEK
jgi:hypothetical protein